MPQLDPNRPSLPTFARRHPPFPDRFTRLSQSSSAFNIQKCQGKKLASTRRTPFKDCDAGIVSKSRDTFHQIPPHCAPTRPYPNFPFPSSPPPSLSRSFPPPFPTISRPIDQHKVISTQHAFISPRRSYHAKNKMSAYRKDKKDASSGLRFPPSYLTPTSYTERLLITCRPHCNGI